MPNREIATVENCIAEARQMQLNGKYINGTIFHMLADEVERLRSIEKAAQAVLGNFRASEAQGYRSRDRQYAIEVLGAWCDKAHA